VTDKTLNLLLTLNIPNPHNAVLPSRNQIFSIGGEAKRLIEVTFNRSIVLFTLKKKFLLAFEIPLNKRAIFGCSKDRTVVHAPLQCSDGLFVSLQEYFLVVSLLVVPSCKFISYVIEELALLLENLPLESSSEDVVFLLIKYVNFGFSAGFCLERVKEVILSSRSSGWLLQLF
jgi:hypothetical protein